MLSTLSVSCMMQGETPSARQGSRIWGSSRRLFRRRRNPLLGEVRNRTTQTLETAWERMVAQAAPATPRWKPKMRMGSRTILHTAPMRTVSMLVVAYPWAVMKALSPRES